MERRQLISVVIPALNEEQGIKQTINSIPKQELSDQGYDLEILVIDGYSTDRTKAVAESLGANVISEKRKGYGRAYKTGFHEAKGDIIVTLDADGTYPAELVPCCIEKLNEKGLDFVTLNRFSKMEDDAMRFSHRIGNKILSFTMLLLYSIDVKDSQSGMWIMTRKFIKAIDLMSDDFSLSEEIKIIAFRYFKALELEGKYYKRIGREKLLTFDDGWNNLKYLFRYKSHLNSATKSLQDTVQKERI